MLLHNMKIRSKLFIAFGLFIVLMIVSSGLSLFSLDRTNTSMQNIITHDYPTTVKANLLIDNFQDFVSTQQLMLLDEEGRWSQESQKQLDAISQRITVFSMNCPPAVRTRLQRPLSPEFAMCVSSIWPPGSVFCRKFRTMIVRRRYRK